MTTIDMERTCTLVPRNGDANRESASKPLSEYRSTTAFVLLGDPGAGKTTGLKHECARMSDCAAFLPARDFVTFDVDEHPEWRDRALFIDGLDEIRAGDDDPRTALDRVRAQLDRLGKPAFRLSCREADWLGSNDRNRLEAVAPDGRVTVLRLDPLTPREAEAIAAGHAVENAAAFLRQARERGLDGLLGNPQNLTLLASAVAGGSWPESRRELFELACRYLVAEENEEHRFAGGPGPSPEELLGASGRICALLLLSGTTGVQTGPSALAGDSLSPPVERLDPPPAGVAPESGEAALRLRRLALGSRLFAVAGPSAAAGAVEPIHRHIAEFLAGRYLADRVEAGLPPARVIALISSSDGGVVTVHRGLSAWLAAHSREARLELIDRDPIGVGLYGDIGGFSSDERKALLQALIREERRLDNIDYRNVAAFAPLAAPPLEAELRALLTARMQNEDDWLSLKFVLRLLSYGTPMPALVEPARRILYRKGWRREVTWAALDAFIRQCADPAARTRELKDVLRDVQGGSLDDMHNELCATVLEELYPETIGPADIWRHLDRCQPTSSSGRHEHFWTHTINERTPDEDIATLLDALASQRPDLALVDNGFGHGRASAEGLLARALELDGDDLSAERLYAWLNAPARTDEEFRELRTSHSLSKAVSELSDPAPPPGGEPQEAWDSASKVRSWLEAHPGAYKAALLEGICRYTDEWDLQKKVARANDYLRHAEPPADFGLWCLEQARETPFEKPELARWLFANACQRLEHGENGLSQQLIDEAARQRPSLRPATPVLEAANELREASRRNKAAADAFKEQRRRREQGWLDAVRKEVPALEANRGAPKLLYDLALRWFQRSHGRIPLLNWLRQELGNEDDLAAAVAKGLRGVIDRDDVPAVDEVLRLHGESRIHYLSTPFLVSLDERESANSRLVETMTEQQRRQASVFYCSALTRHDSHPNWYRELVSKYPQTVAKVLLSLARTELQVGRENISGMWDLAHDDGHADLAGLVSLPLLRGFPVRCRARQLHNLIRLLWTALQHANPHELLAVIEKKLAGKSMTKGQRVLWLAAGVIADPDGYANRLAEFIDGQELRARELARFLWSEHPALFRPAELPPRALEVLIRQSGAAFGVYEIADEPRVERRPGRGRGNAQPESVWWRITDLIECLAASPAPEAGAALRRLADDETLQRWRCRLREAFDRQAVIARDSSYRRPELDQILATLDDLTPANAADLAALALDRLDELSRTIRHSNTNDWRQFWNEDEYGQPDRPKREESCRDALLKSLRTLLPDGIDAQPEGQYVANRRADIRLSCADFHVPIEIKKQSHPALYRAARDQLVARYAQDPATGGHGIFLALWFGDPEKAPLDETGTRPGTPEELRQRLVACLARQLRPQQLRKIAVRVIDVSKP